MLLSYCIPCCRREADLTAALPHVIEAANASPPVEIIVVDYANPEPLAVDWSALEPPNAIAVMTYRGREHYHVTHARNLAFRRATGEYVVSAMADVCPKPGYFALIRKRLDETGATYLLPVRKVRPARTWPLGVMPGMIVVRRDEILATGGFDERMEWYGGEDKELGSRLQRRGSGDTYVEEEGLDMIPTPNAVRIANFRKPNGVGLSKMAMMRLNRRVRYENETKEINVVNEGIEWGAP